MITFLHMSHGSVTKRPSTSRTRQAGFTLIEVMIAVLIIAVLSAIAYPSYDNHVINSRRAAAAVCLMERAQFMERYYTTNMSYADAPAPAPCQELQGHYTVSMEDLAATTYTLLATPQGRQASKDTTCGILSLNQQGVRSAEKGTAAQCW